MSKSLLQDDKDIKACLVCGTTHDLHRHHIYGGVANRKLSEEDGCWCYLCPRHHNMSNMGVHFNKTLDLKLKQCCQKKWEEKNGDRTAFIQRFGKNYL